MKLYGNNPVLERLKSNPQSIRRIFIQFGHKDASYVLKKAQQRGISAVQVPASKIQKLARSLNAQGVVADVEEFAFTPYSDVLTDAVEKGKTLIFLDSLNDPQNLGAIIRSLACLGGFSLVLPTHRCVGITEAVLRVACGGENHLLFAKVSNLNQALSAAKKEDFCIAGAVVEGGKDPGGERLPFPLAVVIGSEQKGIRSVVHQNLDLLLTVPMAQPRLSLNVAHAATLLAYEISRQRHLGGHES